MSTTTTEPTSFTWSIENFSSCDSDGFIASPHFVHNQYKFYLTLLPNGVTIRNAPWSKSHIFIYLWLVSDHENVKIKYELAILRQDGSKFNAQDGNAHFISNKKVLYNWQYNVSRNFLLDLDNNFLHDDKLSVFCKIYNNESTENLPIPAEPVHSISSDFEELLLNGKLADFVLNVKGKEFPVHKAILAARSPVFAAMFEHDTIEVAQSKVDIDDLSPEVVEQMLVYIYTDKAEAVSQFDFDLLVAADKYQLESLKSTCEQELIELITVESVSNYLLLSDIHNALKLRAKCIDFITDNPKKVIATEGWTEVTTVRPELGLLLFQYIVRKLDK